MILESDDTRTTQTKNKTVMQYAIEYVDIKKKNQNELWQINYVRLKKGILLPCELVRTKGKLQTECY